MEISHSDAFYLGHDEPVRSCFLALRQIILEQDKHVNAAWKYGMPFFCYKGKMFCYLWWHKRYQKPYLGIVEGQRVNHPELLQEKRSRMKILLVDATQDIPLATITGILNQSLDLYRKALSP